MRLVSILIGLVAILPACSDAPDHPVDHGAPSKVYPAFALSVPQVVSLHHAVLENPEVRAVTFASDPLAPHAQDLVAHLADPAYWGATAQYGVGPLSAGAPIVVAEPAPDRADVSQVEAWLTEKLDGAHPEFGLPDAKTIYVVVYPASTMVAYEDSKRWCGAYHYGVTIGQTMVNYAVIADCASPPSDAEFVPLDSAISHEVVEAATDPLGASGFGGYTVDGDHLAWDYLYTPSPLALSSGREVGDLARGRPTDSRYPTRSFTCNDSGRTPRCTQGTIPVCHHSRTRRT